MGGRVDPDMTLAQQLYAALNTMSLPWDARFDLGRRCAEELCRLQPAAPPVQRIATLLGYPARVDEDMPTDAWRVVDSNGDVLAEGRCP